MIKLKIFCSIPFSKVDSSKNNLKSTVDVISTLLLGFEQASHNVSNLKWVGREY